MHQMDYQKTSESSCLPNLTMTEAFYLVSLCGLCGASLIISIPAFVVGILEFYVTKPNLRPERLMVYLTCGACVTSALGSSQWVSLFAAHSHIARLVCSIQSYVWLMVAVFFFMVMLSFGTHFFIQKWKHSTDISSISLYRQPVLPRAVEITCICISSLVTAAIVPSAKVIFGSHLCACWIDSVTDSKKNIFEVGGMDVMVPSVTLLGIASFSLVIVLILKTCIHDKKHVSLDFYSWSYIVVIIILLVVIPFLNPMGTKPVKTLILSFIPLNSLLVSSIFFQYKKLIGSCSSHIQQGSTKQISFFKDDQDIGYQLA